MKFICGNALNVIRAVTNISGCLVTSPRSRQRTSFLNQLRQEEGNVFAHVTVNGFMTSTFLDLGRTYRNNSVVLFVQFPPSFASQPFY